MPSPLSEPTAWSRVAYDYAESTAPFFANFAEPALEAAKVSAGHRVLDVACGPGTLTFLAAKRGAQVTAVDFAPAMIEELQKRASSLPSPIQAQVADGQVLPFADSSYDAAFSMFGLIFFPDRGKGFAELHRVLAPRGVAVISSWQPMERFPMLGDVFAALAKLLPNLPFGEGKAPLGSPDEIIAEMSAAGFASVQVKEVSASATVPSIEQAWAFMCRGSAPFALLRRNVGDARWLELQQGILDALRAKYGPGEQTLTMVANLGIGQKR